MCVCLYTFKCSYNDKESGFTLTLTLTLTLVLFQQPQSRLRDDYQNWNQILRIRLALVKIKSFLWLVVEN